jgi:hypothetical protein
MLAIADTSPLYYLGLSEHTAILPRLLGHALASILPPTLKDSLVMLPCISRFSILRIYEKPRQLIPLTLWRSLSHEGGRNA